MCVCVLSCVCAVTGAVMCFVPGPFSPCSAEAHKACGMKRIYDAEGTLQHFIDGNDPSKSSWMRYIRCARHCGEQNMMVVQYSPVLLYTLNNM
ncbi:hypothetical protein L3Q82_006990 [Scortum barcoo]|uniref:Uncharacterized protein n=1 Tax=Scortum barcoo TaxID=214431 RepID=A0ACB8WWE4_9TELE|nr:hypothetical protein L3Q82_006990 [Scortum barcoo]